MLVLLTSLLTFSLATLYFTHRSLRSTLHTHHQPSLPPATTTRITSLPKDLTAHPENYSVFYDRASRPVSRRLLPDIPLPELLTHLLRRNMAAFAHFPQAWLLWFSCRSGSTERGSFRKGYIQKLEFGEGECVCGVYRVAARKENQVELEMSRGAVGGRLVVGYDVDKIKETVTFSNETIMWCQKDEGRGKIPLENRMLRFFHEMTAWWLMDSGVCFLMDMDGSEIDERIAFEKDNGE